MDTTNTENVTTLDPTDSISLDAFNEETPDTTPAGTVVVVNGVTCTPETHVFRDGSPVLKKDGTPKLKPGRKTGISPHKKADAVASDDSTPQTVSPTNEALAVFEALGELAATESPKPQPSVPQAPSIQRNVTATVQRSFGPIGAVEAEDTTLSVRTFVTQPATVELGYGLTVNIGNYESARVDVKLSVPCYREESEAAYEWARTWVEERVRKEVVEIKNVAAGQKSSPF